MSQLLPSSGTTAFTGLSGDLFEATLGSLTCALGPVSSEHTQNITGTAPHPSTCDQAPHLLGSHNTSVGHSAICPTWLVLRCSNHTDEAPPTVGATRTPTPASSPSPSPTSARLSWQMAVLPGKASPTSPGQRVRVGRRKRRQSLFTFGS